VWYWIGPHWEYDRLVSQPKWSRRAVPEALLPRRTAAPPPVPRTGKSREGQAGPFSAPFSAGPFSFVFVGAFSFSGPFSARFRRKAGRSSLSVFPGERIESIRVKWHAAAKAARSCKSRVGAKNSRPRRLAPP
jgi:hypothetical protein